MLITIYDSVGNPKIDLSPNDSSTQVKEVQGDSVLTLSFTHYDHIELDVDDYADFLGERFWLTEKYRPRQNSRKEWVYDLKLYGVECMIKRLLVIKTVDNEENPVFTLTAPPRDHVAMIVKCMNDGMGNITDWKVGQVNGTENLVIDYFGKYCDEALREIAEKVGAEWWVEGQTVNICKCEHGDSVELGYNKGLLSIDPGTADNVKFYTRLYPMGSSRNIDPEKYGFSRLQLPGGQKYVEINADKYGRVDHFEQSAFEDIYPRRVGVVSSVRSEVKTGEDGNPFTIYYFTDNSLPFDPNDYMIGGLVIRVSFQEGSELAGLGDEDNGTYFFEVNFNSTTREFEIITIWPYDNDIQLPGDKLVPKAGDKYILWNLRMPDEYYALAEEEFLTAVNKYNADHNLDISVYKAPTDHVWIEDNNVELSIGSRVRLVSDEYFPGFGFRDSRITKITRKVNLPSSMDIEISDALSRTAQERIADSIAEVRGYAQSIGESISLPDIIRTGDRTRPTDNNLFSALRSLKTFVRKDSDDRTPYALAVGGRLTAETETGSMDFAEGLTGFGWQIDRPGNIWADSLSLRRFLEVPELRYNRTEVIVGNQWQAPGAGIVESYTHLGTSKADDNGDGEESNCNIGVLTLKLEDGELGSLSEGDLCMGIWHFGKDADGNTSDKEENRDTDDNGMAVFQFAGFTTVYFIVYKVEGKHRETLHVRTREKWDAEPAVGMHFVAFGNRKWNYKDNQWQYPDRQKSAYRTRTYERFLVNVNDWEIGEDNIAMQFGDLSNLTIAGTNMAGYSAYLNNIYMAGVIRQLDAKLRLEIRTSGDHYVADGDSCLAMIYVFHGANDVSTETEQNKLLLTAKRKGDGLMVPIMSSENGNFMTLDKSLLGTSDSATVTVTATYTDYKGKTFTASADIVIYDRALLKGDKGDKGIPGTPGKDGKTSYFHVKYAPVANPTAAQMSETPDVYIGTYVDYTEADSNDPTKYTWARFQGAQGKDGTNGIPGTDGQNGQTSYLHIKYSDDGGLTFTPAQGSLAVGETPGKYIGQYVDFVEKDSTKVSDYKWSKFEGDNGENGSSYTENLLTGTRGFTAPWTIGSGSAANGSYEGLTIVECDLTATGAAAYADLAFRDYAFTDGETYTLSFWARTGVSGTRSYVHVPVPGVVIASDGIPNTAVTTTTWHMFELGATAPWRRYRITFKAATVPFAAAHNVLFRLYGGNEGNAVQLAGVKLERGENAHTEWSPATEEMLGKDAVNIIVSPSSLVVNNNRRHTLSTTKVYVDLYDGDKQVNYSSGTDSDDAFLCSTLTESTSTPIDPEGNVEWRFGTDNSTGVNRFFYYFHIAEGTVIDRTIPFTVTYKGRTYQSQLGLKTVSDGADGQNGKDAVTYDWLVSPDIIHCDYDGSVLIQTINVRCFRIEGTTRTDVKTGIRYKIGNKAFAALPSNGSIALMKSTLAGVVKPTMTLQLVDSDSAQTVLSEHVTGYICDGETGHAGPQGSVVRIRGLFTADYYYDGKTADNSSGTPVYWLDVVWTEDAAGNRFYKRCTIAGNYTEADGPHASDIETASGWADFSQLDNLIVELLIAKNAHIKFLNGQEIIFGNVENGVERTWGRIGYPTQTDNLIMYAGGATSGLATFTLDKEGKARFGAMSGERIEIEPTDMEMRVFDGDNRQVATIDGKTHDINGLYGCKFNIPKNFAPGYVTEGKSYTIGEFEVGDEGAAFHASIAAHLYTETSFVPGYGETSSPTYIGIFAESHCEAHLKLARVDDSREIDSGNASLGAPSHDGMTTSIRPVTKSNNEDFTLTINAPNLTKGTYRLTLSVGITNGETTKDTRKAVATASVTLGMLSRTFKTGNSPRALLCANGLIVANSTQDYLVAGMSGGTFNVEAHAGERGIRLDKSGVVMQDDNGAWTQGFAEHCTQRAVATGLCVGKTQGVRHWMTDSSTNGLPAGASKYGALTTYTIDNGGGNHIQEYRSFDSVMMFFTRRCLNGTWTEWHRQF